VSDWKYAIDTGAPAAAFAALKSLLSDETKKQTIAASQATAAFALKTSLALVDGGAISGPVVAALSALATLAQVVFSGSRVARDEGDKQGAGRCRIGRSAVSHVPAYGLLFDGRRDAERLENTKLEFDKIYRSAARLVDASPTRTRAYWGSCRASAHSRVRFQVWPD
jgi:hypothetical protein